MHKDDIGKDNQMEVIARISRLRMLVMGLKGTRQEGEGCEEERQGPGAGSAITPVQSVHSSITTVCSAQSQTDHSATQRARGVAQQDARTSQAKVKPKLSVGVELLSRT